MERGLLVLASYPGEVWVRWLLVPAAGDGALCLVWYESPPSKHSAEPEPPFSCMSWPQGSLFTLQDAALSSV